MDNRRINIRLFYAITLLQGLVFYGPIATLYRQAQGLSVFDITIIESISLIVMMALEGPWGFITDKVGYKKTILICNVLFFISKIVFWKADSFILFLSERLILSVVMAGLSGCDSAYLYLLSGEKDSQRAFGIYEAMGTAGLICASVIFSAIVKTDYGMAAFLTVIAYFMAMVLSLFLIEVKPKEKENIRLSQQLKMIALSFGQNKGFVMFLLAAALLGECNQTITVFLNQLQYLRSGILPQYMGYIYILVTVSGLLSVCSYRIIELFGETAAIKLLFCSAGAACAFMALFSNPVVSVLGIVIIRVSASVFVPVRMDIENRQVAIDNRATMLSIYSIITNTIAVGINLIFGKMADISVKYAMATGAVFCFGGLIIYSVWQYKNRFREERYDI